MRPLDRYRQRYKKNPQPTEIPKSEAIDWDFVVNDEKRQPTFKITFGESRDESEIEKFERYIRQLSRCVHACSLCERGCSFYEYKNYSRSPHSPPSIWHRNIALIKYEPNHLDINGLFEDQNLKSIFNKYSIKKDHFYCTSIIKCPKSLFDTKIECPYFDLEWQAIQECLPKLLILFDKKSAGHLGLEYKIGSTQQYENSKVICIGDNYEGMETILKILSNPQIRNRLIS